MLLVITNNYTEHKNIKIKDIFTLNRDECLKQLLIETPSIVEITNKSVLPKEIHTLVNKYKIIMLNIKK